MTPASESGDETLSFGAQPNLSLGTGSAGSSVGNSATVETVTPGSATSLSQRSPAQADPTATGSNAAQTTSDTAQPTDSSASSDPGSAQAQPANSTTPAAPADKSQESTSKKKKGLHKVIPF
jgi:hypothetical protein